jgi:Arc/MetJ-type ribon-helix-helix transcriptional regulator
MKKRISATVEGRTIEIIKRILRKGKYRNKSHIIEEAIKLLEEKE